MPILDQSVLNTRPAAADYTKGNNMMAQSTTLPREAPIPGAADLFTPVRLGAYGLANRAVMAPMTRNRAGPGNVPQAINAEYYRQRATAGLIITEGSQVSPQGVGYPSTPGIHSPAQVAAWRRVTDAVHAEGGRIFLQLWHVGRVSHPSLQPQGALPVAPSAIAPEGETVTYEGLQPFVTPRALGLKEIPGVVAEFGSGAVNALAAGFDGVEIHAANGYLIDQFLRDGSNRREDEYGGSIANRARFLIEVAQAVVDVWGADRVGVRFSPLNPFNSVSDSDPAAIFGYAARALGRFGLAYLHLAEMAASDAEHAAFDWRGLAGAFGGTIIANAGYDRARADAAIAGGWADLVAFGVPFLANPDLVARLKRGVMLNDPDQATFYGGAEAGYTDYPFLTG